MSRFRAYSDPVSPNPSPPPRASTSSRHKFRADPLREHEIQTHRPHGGGGASRPGDPSSSSNEPQSRLPHPQSRSGAVTSESLTQASLELLQLSEDLPSRPTRWPMTSAMSYGGIASGSIAGGGGAGPSRPRLASLTPSTTSISDGEGEEPEDEGGGRAGKVIVQDDEGIRNWLHRGLSKGKGKAVGPSNTGREGVATTLPPEILLQIFRLMPERDLLSALLVSRSWCLCAFSLLWNRPVFTHPYQLASMARTLFAQPPAALPYATSVRRLMLSNIAGDLTDDLFIPLEHCTRLERLNIGGASRLSSKALARVISNMPGLVAVDVNAIPTVTDEVIQAIASTCEKLQGVNFTGCSAVTDEGIVALANHAKMLRRFKVANVYHLTDTSIVAIARSCPVLLEVDLEGCVLLSNASLYSILLSSSQLRELKMNNNIKISDEGVPDLADLVDMSEEETERMAHRAPWFATTSHGQRSLVDQFDRTRTGGDKPLRMLRPAQDSLDHLRLVDFSGCTSFNDGALEKLIKNAPKLRTLTVAKCGELTERGVQSIAGLGKHLHYLHLGHVPRITDVAVTKLARSCTRLRYIDLACCPGLTDLSVFELAANLPKLRRIGLVKVVNVTDEGIYSLAERHATLERIHLSYCEKVSVKAVAFLLNRVPRLTHLSLTSVSAFKTPELQQFCRPPPPDFNDHQMRSFCVYSGHGITALRNHLNMQTRATTAGSDSPSTRRGSTSSTSSITVEAAPTERHHVHSHAIPSATSSPAYRRGSAPVYRNNNTMDDRERDRDRDRDVDRRVHFDGLSSAFAGVNSNIFSWPMSPTPPREAPHSHGSRHNSPALGSTAQVDRSMPGGYHYTNPFSTSSQRHSTAAAQGRDLNSRSSSISSAGDRGAGLPPSAAWRSAIQDLEASGEDQPVSPTAGGHSSRLHHRGSHTHGNGSAGHDHDLVPSTSLNSPNHRRASGPSPSTPSHALTYHYNRNGSTTPQHPPPTTGRWVGVPGLGIDTEFRDQATGHLRRASDVVGSPLRWVAGMVGWSHDEAPAPGSGSTGNPPGSANHLHRS